MPRTILLIPLLLGTAVGTASMETAGEVDLAGIYVCDGMSPAGRPYQGLVRIVKNRDTYELLWTIESRVAAIGIGIQSGDVLAVMHYVGVPGVVA